MISDEWFSWSGWLKMAEKNSVIMELVLSKTGMTRIVNYNIKSELIPTVSHFLYTNMSYPTLSNACL